MVKYPFLLKLDSDEAQSQTHQNLPYPALLYPYMIRLWPVVPPPTPPLSFVPTQVITSVLGVGWFCKIEQEISSFVRRIPTNII